MSDPRQSTLTQVGGPLAPGADPGAGAAATFSPPLAAAAPNFAAPEWAGAVGVIRHQVRGEWRMELHCEAGGRMMIVPMTLASAEALGLRLLQLAALKPGQPADLTAPDLLAMAANGLMSAAG